MDKKHFYKAVGPVRICEYFYEYGEEDPVEIKEFDISKLTDSQLSILKSVLKNDDSTLEKWIPKDYLVYGLVEKILFDAEHYGSNTTIITNKELSEEELQNLKKYINGQFSDGWGAHLFQYPFLEEDTVLAADFGGVNTISKLTDN